MKKVAFILMSFLLLSASTVSAAVEPSTISDPAVAVELGELLGHPDFIISEEHHAQVTIHVNKDQEIVVLSVDTRDSQIETYLKHRLNYKKTSTLEIGKEYIVPVRITSQN